MDALVALFFPEGRKVGRSAEKGETFNRADISAATRRHNQIVAEMKARQKLIIERRNQDYRAQRDAVNRKASMNTNSAPSSRVIDAAGGAFIQKHSAGGENAIATRRKDYAVSFTILKHPGETVLQDAMIGEFRTSRNATVGHLKSFVKSVLNIKMGTSATPSFNVDIIITLPGEGNSQSCGSVAYRITDSLLTLGALSKLFSDRKLPPILTYGSCNYCT